MATPNQKYTLTPEHFARARADLDRRRAQLNDSHEAAVAAVAGHETAKALLDDEVAKLEADERTASDIAKRYWGAADAPPPSAPPSRARRSNFGDPIAQRGCANKGCGARRAGATGAGFRATLLRGDKAPRDPPQAAEAWADRRSAGARPGAGVASFRKPGDC